MAASIRTSVDTPRTRKRADGPRCVECVHDQNGECYLEFPERKANGDVAAIYCVAFASERML